jgi:hypothetical protein
MGYDTKFWGSLKFTRRLTESELQTVEAILDAGQTSTPEIDAVVEREREERRKPGRAEFINVGNEIMRRAELQGFIAPKGWPDHIDLDITDDRRGLCYCAEKTYTMVEAVNFIIANGRQRIPDFGLKGSMFAETEFAPYHWLLKIDPDGWAMQQPCRMTRAIAYSPRRYAEHLRLNWRSPSVW